MEPFAKIIRGPPGCYGNQAKQPFWPGGQTTLRFTFPGDEIDIKRLLQALRMLRRQSARGAFSGCASDDAAPLSALSTRAFLTRSFRVASEASN